MSIGRAILIACFAVVFGLEGRVKPWWVLQDGGGDVAALVETPLPGAQAVVAGQWTYDAYGSCLTAEHLRSYPLLHCGHKALFFDRLDVGVVASSGDEIARLLPYAHAVYQVRNRAYAPALGRFYQRDPNATAMALIEVSAYHGRGLSAIINAFSMEEMYGDGMNLYQYLGSNPWRRHDHLGLSEDPFDMVDEYLAESAGSTAAFLEQITDGLKAAAYVGAIVLSQLPFPVTAIAADIGADVLEGNMPASLVAARRILGYAAIGTIAVAAGRIAWSAGRAAVQYVMKYGLRGAIRDLANGAVSLAKRAWDWLRKPIAGGGCGCFAAGTLIWTASGLVPIDQVHVGDLVIVRDEVTGLILLEPVTAEVVTQNAALLLVAFSPEEGGEEVLETTDDHPFMVENRGWIRAATLRPGDVVRRLNGLAAVTSVGFTSQRASVHNLSVAGAATYFVGLDGILVHNCPFIPGNPFRGSDAFKRAVEHLSEYHVPPEQRAEFENLASRRLHKIKGDIGVPNDMDMVFGKTGDVYHPVSGDRLGSLLHD